MKLLSIKTVCLAAVAAFLFSCNKEVIVEPNINGPAPVNPGGTPDPGNGNGNGSGSTAIVGTYRIVYMYQDGISSTVAGAGADRTEVKYNYTTTFDNFTGNYIIDSKNIVFKGLGYAFNMLGTMVVTGGGFNDSIPYGGPATLTFPDASSPYQLKGADSIITKSQMGGSVNGMPSSSNTSGIADTQTSYYTFSGDTLIMKTHIVITNRVMVQDGQTAIANGTTNAIIKMVRVK